MTNPVLHEQTGMITRWIMGFGHEVTSKSKAPWLSRWAIISAYFSSSSTPTTFRPRFRAATRVEPEPANGSAITPSGARSISFSIRPTGLGVGCPIRATSNDLASEVLTTVLIGGDELLNPDPVM